MSKKAILIITDGIGHNESNSYNAFTNANTPTYDYLFKNTPYSLIHTYGKYVGLPDGQMGNSEVGHMTIGSGRVLYQDLVKINMAIENDTLKNNEIIKTSMDKSNNVHLIGLASDGGVHSHINHIIALAKIAKSKGKKYIFMLLQMEEMLHQIVQKNIFNNFLIFVMKILNLQVYQEDIIQWIEIIDGKEFKRDTMLLP